MLIEENNLVINNEKVVVRYLPNNDPYAVKSIYADIEIGRVIQFISEEYGYNKVKVTEVSKDPYSDDIIIRGLDITEPFIRSFYNSLKPEKTISVSEWARQYRVLDSSASSKPGKYDPDFTPFLIEPMDMLTVNNGIKEVIVMKSAQIGGTEAGQNFLGYIMDISPGPTMIIQPTSSLAKQFSREKLSSLVSSSPRIRDKIEEKNNNLDMKVFPGGYLKLSGANSEVSLRSSSIKFQFYDEIDAYPHDVDGKGDPIKLAEARTIFYEATKKMFKISTPTIKGFSNIEKAFLRGDQRYYNIACPHCEQLQYFVWEGIKYRPNANNKKLVDKKSIYYECIKCKDKILESQKTKLMKEGKWIPTRKGADPSVVSYSINALYSPIGIKSWESIINDFLDAEGDKVKMKTFTNVLLGLPYQDESFRPDARKLEKRKSSFREWTCPDDVVYINCAVDVQDNRLAACVMGYGKNSQMYVISYQELWGDTSQSQVWDELLMLSKRPIIHESGVELFITDGAIDTGGHRMSMVLDFCREHRHFLPVKGRSDSNYGYSIKVGSNLDKDKDGVEYANPLHLYIVNTVLNKKIIFEFLNNDNPGKNYVHFNADLKSDFFDMLCSEELVISIINGKVREEFRTLTDNTRNEVLDCVDYSLAVARGKLYHTLVGKSYEEAYETNIAKRKVIKTDVKIEPRNPLQNNGQAQQGFGKQRNSRFSRDGQRF